MLDNLTPRQKRKILFNLIAVAGFVIVTILIDIDN